VFVPELLVLGEAFFPKALGKVELPREVCGAKRNVTVPVGSSATKG
jgi:hypothetical protein